MGVTKTHNYAPLPAGLLRGLRQSLDLFGPLNIRETNMEWFSNEPKHKGLKGFLGMGLGKKVPRNSSGVTWRFGFIFPLMKRNSHKHAVGEYHCWALEGVIIPWPRVRENRGRSQSHCSFTVSRRTDSYHSLFCSIILNILFSAKTWHQSIEFTRTPAAMIWHAFL